MVHRLLERGGPHRLDVESNALALAAVAVLLQGPDLVEGTAEVGGAEDLVLVVLQAVLVVEVDAPELVVVGRAYAIVVGRVGKGRRWIEGALDQRRPRGPGRSSCRRHRSCDRRSADTPGPSARLAWASPRILDLSCSWLQDRVHERRSISGDRGLGALRLAGVGPLAGEPEDVILAVQLAGDVDGPLRPVEGVLAVGGSVRGEGAVDRVRVFPEPRGDELDEQPFAVEDLLDGGDPLLLGRPVLVGGGRRSPSWNWTASKPSSLYALSLRPYSTSLRDGRAGTGRAPVLMFQGPKVNRYLVGLAPVAMGGEAPTGRRRSVRAVVSLGGTH